MRAYVFACTSDRPGSHGTPTHAQTAAQPLESLLLPADFDAAINAAGARPAPSDDLESAKAELDDEAEEEEVWCDSVLPDGWDVGKDGKFVDVTGLQEEAERPTRSTGWTPWRF